MHRIKCIEEILHLPPLPSVIQCNRDHGQRAIPLYAPVPQEIPYRTAGKLRPQTLSAQKEDGDQEDPLEAVIHPQRYRQPHDQKNRRNLNRPFYAPSQHTHQHNSEKQGKKHILSLKFQYLSMKSNVVGYLRYQREASKPYQIQADVVRMAEALNQ